MGANTYPLRRSQPFRSMYSRVGIPHRRYRQKRYLPIVDNVLKKIRRGIAIHEIHATSRIPLSTLDSWAAKLKRDPNWSLESTKMESHRRIFTVSEEKAIADKIRTEIIDKHTLLTDKDCRELLLQEWCQKVTKQPRLRRVFSCSSGYIHNFKTRNQFSSRRAHYKRRPQTNSDHCTE